MHGVFLFIRLSFFFGFSQRFICYKLGHLLHVLNNAGNVGSALSVVGLSPALPVCWNRQSQTSAFLKIYPWCSAAIYSATILPTKTFCVFLKEFQKSRSVWCFVSKAGHLAFFFKLFYRMHRTRCNCALICIWTLAGRLSIFKLCRTLARQANARILPQLPIFLPSFAL